MPQYLFTARNKDGKQVTDRIEAATVDGARYALEIRRYTEIIFHTDDASLRIDAALNKEMDPDPIEDFQLDPEQELEARRQGGFFSGIWFAWKAHWFMWLPLLIWCAFIYRGGLPFTASDWIGLALTGLFLAYFIMLIIPGVAFQALLRAAVWNRLGETRFWTGLLRRIPLMSGGGFPKLDLDVRLACVLARNGRADEGRKILAPYLEGPPDSLTLSRISSFHDAAGEYTVAQALRCRASELSNGGLNETIDEALGLARYLHRPAEARACLARIAEKELVEAARIFVTYIEGIIALEERKFSEAVGLFEKTIEITQPMAENELMKGMLREIWAFQSMALAGVGRVKEARALLAKARPLLKARRETEFLQRCEAALRGQ
jgi:hypothetical protein